MRRLSQQFREFPVAWKLLLTAVLPVFVIGLVSWVTYRSVQTFSHDEEQLNNIYLVQRRVAEYMALVVDIRVAYREYVLTGRPRFLESYQSARDRVLPLGEALALMVHDHERNRDTIGQVRLSVERLLSEMGELIAAAQNGRQDEALRYIDQGPGPLIIAFINEQMTRFNLREQDRISGLLAHIARDRTSMTAAIVMDGFVSIAIIIFVLQVIAHSVTGPLTNLARSVWSATSGALPQAPILDRQDEIGHLTRVIAAMNAQIRESESKYRGIVDHAPFGIFTAQGGAMIFSNRYNWILAGLDPDRENDPELILQAIHPEDRARVLKEYTEAEAADRPIEIVFRFLHKDGTLRKVLSRRIPIKNADGRTIMHQGFNIDITALDEMQARLSRMERLSTLGQVAAGIAHEIRNPLVGIGLTASLLLEETDPSDPRRADLDTILSETHWLDRIVNQIVDYVRPRELASQPFNMEDLVREALSMLSTAISDKRLTVDCLIPSSLPSIQADRDLLRQVLLNVIQNAVEAMDEGGRLGLDIAVFDTSHDQEPEMIIKISDSGVGISRDTLARIFEPFYTTGKPRGVGLGLAICQNIMEAHHGQIHVESKVGAGTTVTIRLPLRQPTTLLMV